MTEENKDAQRQIGGANPCPKKRIHANVNDFNEAIWLDALEKVNECSRTIKESVVACEREEDIESPNTNNPCSKKSSKSIYVDCQSRQSNQIRFEEDEQPKPRICAKCNTQKSPRKRCEPSKLKDVFNAIEDLYGLATDHRSQHECPNCGGFKPTTTNMCGSCQRASIAMEFSDNENCQNPNNLISEDDCDNGYTEHFTSDASDQMRCDRQQGVWVPVSNMRKTNSSRCYSAEQECDFGQLSDATLRDEDISNSNSRTHHRNLECYETNNPHFANSEISQQIRDICTSKADPCTSSSEREKNSCDAEEDQYEVDEDPCEIEKDPCEVKEDPCEIEKDPYEVKEDQCEIEEDPCEMEENPCEVKEDPCEVKEDPCEVKEDPCEVKEDPCEVKEDPCEVKEDPCEVKEDPCEIKEDPCEVKEDPCKVKKDPCEIKETTCTDPCERYRNPYEDPCKAKQTDFLPTKPRYSSKTEFPCKPKDPCKKEKEDPCEKEKEDPSKKLKEEQPQTDPCKKDSCLDICLDPSYTNLHKCPKADPCKDKNPLETALGADVLKTLNKICDILASYEKSGKSSTSCPQIKKNNSKFSDCANQSQPFVCNNYPSAPDSEGFVTPKTRRSVSILEEIEDYDNRCSNNLSELPLEESERCSAREKNTSFHSNECLQANAAMGKDSDNMPPGNNPGMPCMPMPQGCCYPCIPIFPMPMACDMSKCWPCMCCQEQKKGNCSSRQENTCGEGKKDDMKNNTVQRFVNSLLCDLNDMRKTLDACMKDTGNKRCPTNTQCPPCYPTPPPVCCEGYPASIHCVRSLGNKSLMVYWVVHDYRDISGYEIRMDGCIKNRYFTSGHDCAVIYGVDLCISHEIELVAIPEPPCPTAILDEDLSQSLMPISAMSGKRMSHFQANGTTWTPSIYIYDPCKS